MKVSNRTQFDDGGASTQQSFFLDEIEERARAVDSTPTSDRRSARTDPAEGDFNRGPNVLTRAELSRRIGRNLTGLSQREIKSFIEDFIEEAMRAIDSEGILKLRKFGSFKVRPKSSRAGRNPRTGILAPVSARRVISFKASQLLKAAVSSPTLKRCKAPSRHASALKDERRASFGLSD